MICIRFVPVSFSLTTKCTTNAGIVENADPQRNAVPNAKPNRDGSTVSEFKIVGKDCSVGINPALDEFTASRKREVPIIMSECCPDCL